MAVKGLNTVKQHVAELILNIMHIEITGYRKWMIQYIEWNTAWNKIDKINLLLPDIDNHKVLSIWWSQDILDSTYMIHIHYAHVSTCYEYNMHMLHIHHTHITHTLHVGYANIMYMLCRWYAHITHTLHMLCTHYAHLHTSYPHTAHVLCICYTHYMTLHTCQYTLHTLYAHCSHIHTTLTYAHATHAMHTLHTCYILHTCGAHSMHLWHTRYTYVASSSKELV